MAVLHQRDVRLVAAHRREDVAGFRDHRETLRLAERGDGLVQAPFLRQRHARQRMDHGEMASIACGVQSGGRLGDVLPHDRHLADLTVAEAQLVVGKADRTRVVGAFRLLQCFGQERDPAGGLAPGNSQAAVHAPQVGEPGRIEPLAPLRRFSQRFGRLPHVVLQKPGFRQSAANLRLLVSMQPRAPEGAYEEACRLGPGPSFQGLYGLSKEITRCHGAAV